MEIDHSKILQYLYKKERLENERKIQEKEVLKYLLNEAIGNKIIWISQK